MEHTDAVKLQAVEKYILGELPPTLRDEFEAHFFDCAECSQNLRAGVAFGATTKQYFGKQPDPDVMPLPWFSWLKPVIAVPAFAALLFVIGYQNLVSIPHLKQVGPGVATVNQWFSLRATNVRGGAGEKFSVRPGHGFSLFVDITAVSSSPDSTFLLQLKDSSGKIIGNSPVSAADARRPVLFSVPAGVPEGQYDLVVLEQAGGSTKEASHLPFAIAFSAQVEQH